MEYKEKTLKVKNQYKGSFFEVETIDVKLPDGNESKRDIIRHPGAAVIIAIDNENKIYMVRQFRKAIEKDLLELPAGKLDFKGEKPIDCAKRELKEETGLTASEFKHLTTIYSAPGIMDEKLHIFLARGLEQGEAEPDEEEFLDVEKYNLKELEKMIFEGELVDSKTIVGIMFIEKILRRT
ncbi:MAG: NUDIX hydrolase [Clostridiales bacterium]